MELTAIAYDLTTDAGADVADALNGVAVPATVRTQAVFAQDRLAIRVLATDDAEPETVAAVSAADAAALGGLLAHPAQPMVRVQSRFIEDRAANLAALRYRVVPGSAEAIRQVFAEVQGEARPTLRGNGGQETGVIVGVGLFVRDDSMIRVVVFDGELDDVARYMAARGGRPDMERKLAPLMAEHRSVETPEQFLEQFRRNTMDRLDLEPAR